jgi:hypothetical protein
MATVARLSQITPMLIQRGAGRCVGFEAGCQWVPSVAGSRRCSPRGIRASMGEYGVWNRKGAVLSDVAAQKEYGVTRDHRSVVADFCAVETFWLFPLLSLLASRS